MRATKVVDPIFAERERIQAEYRRRELEVDPETYAPWQPAEMLTRAERKRWATVMLRQLDAFPLPGEQCLEVGFGSLGWFGDLISWGVREPDLHGIELDQKRAQKAHEVLPLADLRVGDATELPWAARSFNLVITSTVFSSILDADVRRRVAEEISRVLKPGGALLWYDLAVNNPRNPHVRAVGRKELKSLFPNLEGKIRSVTLAPPLARVVAPKSWILAGMLERMPWLRTHLLAVLIRVH